MKIKTKKKTKIFEKINNKQKGLLVIMFILMMELFI